ncbi:MAG: hypothetical protein NTW54_01310 [Bacteroidetes bacterium]|nr:hypothetical protein [Bacteroidota bacterium]
MPILVLLLFIGGAVFFNLRTERQIQKAMHAYNLSYFDARIMLGIDRPSEVVGDGWEAFKGGGAKGDWS